MSAKTYVPPSGDLGSAKFVFVGEQPGMSEVRRGRPFCGPAGEVLDECLRAVRINKSDCYFSNVIKDLDNPLDAYIKLGKSVFISTAGAEYLEALKKELSVLKPGQVVVAVGGVALFALTGRRGITAHRGSILPSELSPNYVVPVVHPATVLPPKFVFKNKLLIQYDLLKAVRVLNGATSLTIKVDVLKEYESAREFLTFVGLSKDSIVDVDIETHNQQVSCIGFHHPDRGTVVIPFICETGDIFTIHQETEIWNMIAQIMENPLIRKRGQNLVFDTNFMLRRYGIHSTNFDDTMILQNTIMPDYPKGLDFITSVWTDIPYYKDEGKKFFKVGGRWETLWQYCGTDAAACSISFPKQYKVLEKQDNVATYNRQVKLIEPLVYMQERGILVDVEGMISENQKFSEQMKIVLEDLKKETGDQDFNPLSPLKVRKYFYGQLGLPAYKKRTGPSADDVSESVDVIAMKRLKRKGIKAAALVLKFRKFKKLTGTYIPIDNEGWPKKVDKDRRIRCSYNPAGTRYSRLSSSENIFETGMNLQNWPHELMTFLLIDPGYIGYSIDLSQAENRIVAYVGNVIPMIEAFETGRDVHTLTAALIFGKTVSEISDEPGSSALGDGTQSERFWGKKANHGLNYDLGYRTFSLYYEIPENEAKFIVERYHRVYPGVRQDYHKTIKTMLARDRTVTNLMGRKTVFLGERNNDLYKEAYSCIPQGTVGDVINERGLEFIYYNSTFEPVELLMQTHDSISFQIPLTLPLQEHAKLLTLIKKELEIPLNFRGREFVIPADITVHTKTWRKEEGTDIKAKKFPKSEELLAEKLKEILNGTTGR